MFSILDRYLLRETTKSWFAITLVLVLILVGNRFARFVGVAAAGALPMHILFTLVGLSSLQNLIYIIPASQLLAIMLALGRMYRDSEITAISACGTGVIRFYKPFLIFGVVLTILTAVLSFWLGPMALRRVDVLENTAKHSLLLTTLRPGHFQKLPHAQGVFYARARGETNGGLKDVFIRFRNKRGNNVILAKRAVARLDPKSGDRQIVLLDGRRYEGKPGQAGFRIMKFGEYGINLQTKSAAISGKDIDQKPTGKLMQSTQPKDRAQLQWRISSPLMVLLLTLLAVPLAYLRPSQGRYAKIVLGVLVYVAYANMLGVAQSWIADGSLAPVFGMWWIHALIAGFGLVLLARRQGWRLWRSRAWRGET